MYRNEFRQKQRNSLYARMYILSTAFVLSLNLIAIYFPMATVYVYYYILLNWQKNTLRIILIYFNASFTLLLT